MRSSWDVLVRNTLSLQSTSQFFVLSFSLLSFTFTFSSLAAVLESSIMMWGKNFTILSTKTRIFPAGPRIAFMDEFKSRDGLHAPFKRFFRTEISSEFSE